MRGFSLARMIFLLLLSYLLIIYLKEPWAMERLRPHANKLACVDLELVSLRVRSPQMDNCKRPMGHLIRQKRRQRDIAHQAS